MPQLKLSGAQAKVLEYALGTALDNERDKGSAGLGEDWLADLGEDWASTRAAWAAAESAAPPLSASPCTLRLSFLGCAVAQRYLQAIEGCADSLDDPDLPEASFEAARVSLCSQLADLEALEDATPSPRQELEEAIKPSRERGP